MSVSVIIPMRNERPFVRQCLDSVLPQLGDRTDIEVLCVDGATTDGTRDIVQEYCDRDPRVRIVDNPRRIVPTGMNAAIREATGDVIVRMDCHTEYAPDYIESCEAVLKRTGADNVGGYMKTLPAKETPVGLAIAAATSHRFGVGGSAFRTGGEEQEADTVPFGCFRRDVFDRFGFYDERLVRNQDIELNCRIRANGGRLIISPDIRLTYYTRSSFNGLRQQAFGNGLWNPYTLYLIGGGVRLRHFIPLVFVLSLLVLGVGSIFLPIARWLLGAEALLYASAAGLVSVRVAQRFGVNALYAFLAFIVLHVSYGVGSLWGVLTVFFRFGFRPQRKRGVSLDSQTS
jgi:glycosyltransferase involved in cell wall biosynthesis